MSKRTLSILSTEIRTVRIVCKAVGCGGVLEIPVGQLANEKLVRACPICHVNFALGQFSPHDPLSLFASAMHSLDRLGAYADVEFVVPEAD